MSEQEDYTPPRVWRYEKENGGAFGGINRPTSGARDDKALPVGNHPLQLYSMATPNGVKVTVMLEELLAAGHESAEYDAWPIDIRAGEQFGSGFVAINPNSKIPALVDRSVTPQVRMFESGAILFYLAEKFGAFLPEGGQARADCLSWLHWQMGAAPFLGGGFGHFYAYAPEKYEYPIDRYTMEVKRQLDLLDKHLAKNAFMTGDAYTIADMAIWPWYAAVIRGEAYDAQEFLAVHEYEALGAWVERIGEREAVKRGRLVNRFFGDGPQVPERHSAEDIDEAIKG